MGRSQIGKRARSYAAVLQDAGLSCYENRDRSCQTTPLRTHFHPWWRARGQGDCFEYVGQLTRLSLDLFWIKDRNLIDTDSLPPPDVIAAEIADDLEAALAQFTKIASRLVR